MSFAASQFNDLFFVRADSSAGREKLAEYGGSYIRDRLREVSYARKILPFGPVTKRDCQRSVNHDTLVKIRDIEANSRAMALTFRGQPRARYIRGARYEIPFFTISSEKFEKTEQELLAYEMPITKVIEDNSIKDMHEIEDREFTIHIESAVQATQEGVNGASGNRLSGGLLGFNSSNLRAGLVESLTITKGEGAFARTVDDFAVQPLQRNDLIDLFNLLDGSLLRLERILITEPDWNDFCRLTLDDFGDKLQSEVMVEGYKYNQILGRKVVRTIKTNVLRRGNIYGFTAPEFLGDAYILNETKFYIDKIANLITWQCWEDIGMGIGNIRSVVKLELYSGSVTPGATDTGYAAKLPVSEEGLEFVNNRADEGLTFPQVSQF
ncbi:MAG: hypothetical protein KDB07_07390 [Planctomycetes bacterium]|nr:hypothetical protein [Planctomycetota bacterium]